MSRCHKLVGRVHRLYICVGDGAQRCTAATERLDLNWDKEKIDWLAGKVWTRCCEWNGLVVMFRAVVQLILYRTVSRLLWVCMKSTYVVVICGAHLQTARSFGTAPSVVAVANDVFESITAAPLSFGSPNILFHGIMFREIVP